jgi:hypothetical protein
MNKLDEFDPKLVTGTHVPTDDQVKEMNKAIDDNIHAFEQIVWCVADYLKINHKEFREMVYEKTSPDLDMLLSEAIKKVDISRDGYMIGG